MFAELASSMTDAAGHGNPLFRQILPFALIGTIAVIAVHLVYAIARRRGRLERAPWSWWECLVYLATLASVLVLGVTSLYTVARFGAMGGWWLFAHMFGAGLFTVVLPVIALTWCEANRFQRPFAEPPAAPAGSRQFPGLSKVTFWLILASGLVVAGTMLLSMLPVFGTHGLDVLLHVHRWAGLVTVAAAAVHFYAAIIARLRLA